MPNDEVDKNTFDSEIANKPTQWKRKRCTQDEKPEAVISSDDGGLILPPPEWEKSTDPKLIRYCGWLKTCREKKINGYSVVKDTSCTVQLPYLPDEATPGLLGDIVKAATIASETTPAAVLANLLTVSAAAFGRSHYQNICAFRRIRPPSPKTSGHLIRSIRPGCG